MRWFIESGASRQEAAAATSGGRAQAPPGLGLCRTQHRRDQRMKVCVRLRGLAHGTEQPVMDFVYNYFGSVEQCVEAVKEDLEELVEEVVSLGSQIGIIGGKGVVWIEDEEGVVLPVLGADEDAVCSGGAAEEDVSETDCANFKGTAGPPLPSSTGSEQRVREGATATRVGEGRYDAAGEEDTSEGDMENESYEESVELGEAEGEMESDECDEEKYYRKGGAR